MAFYFWSFYVKHSNTSHYLHTRKGSVLKMHPQIYRNVLFLYLPLIGIPFVPIFRDRPGFMDFRDLCPSVPINSVRDAKRPVLLLSHILGNPDVPILRAVPCHDWIYSDSRNCTAFRNFWIALTNTVRIPGENPC
jgi:hypothetical protein